MMKFIDDFLDRITMYRLILYYLIVLVIFSVGLGYAHFFTFDPLNLVFSTLFLIFFGGFVNDLFSKIFKAPVNVESSYITSLILALIITPVSSLNDFIFLGWAVVLAMASKYILAIKRIHIFNPAAITVVLTAIGLNKSASWWVGTPVLLPIVIIGGLLIVRKIRREDMIYSFLFTVLLMISILSLFGEKNLINNVRNTLFHSSLFFFAFVMLTEPLTTPPTKILQIIYAVITAVLFVPQVHFGAIYSTPEVALVIGNIFSYLVSPKEKLFLKLKEKNQLSPDIYDFIFPLNKNLVFLPGQYMEWTLAHQNVDSRGNRRYFTLASSPTENNIRLGIKFYPSSSSYKKALLQMDNDTTIVTSRLVGEFILPKDPHIKLVFMAGGIGITPFRSILKYLIDRNEKRDIVIFYSNKYQSEIIYKDILNEANKKLGIKTVFTLTDKYKISSSWIGEKGRIDIPMIEKILPDYRERIFYLSGPHIMVTSFEEVLREMGIKKNKIKVDFFPGYV